MNYVTQTSDILNWDSYIPNEETEALVASAREHFASLFSLDDLRKVFDGQSRPNLWPQIESHGYPAIGLPEDLDGIGTPSDLLALLEEAGRSLLPAPLLTCAMASQTLLATSVLSEETSGSALAFAHVTSGGVTVFDGFEADFAVAVDASAEHSRVRLFDLSGSARTVIPAIDPARPNVTIAEPSINEVEFEVEADIDAVLSGARLCVAADLLGVSSRALDASVVHALTRKQFGQPIGSFQAVKHQLADAYVALERARSLVLGGGVALCEDALSAESARLSMLAKAAAAEAAAHCTVLQTQLLGALGLTFESESPWCFRRVQHTNPLLGGPSELYSRVAAIFNEGF